jgi:hypothetical protein
MRKGSASSDGLDGGEEVCSIAALRNDAIAGLDRQEPIDKPGRFE